MSQWLVNILLKAISEENDILSITSRRNNTFFDLFLNKDKSKIYLAIVIFFSDNGHIWSGMLQPWPELLGHKGNNPEKWRNLPLPLPLPLPEAMLMSGIQVIFDRLNIAWGREGAIEMVYLTTLPTFLSLFNEVHFPF